MRKNYKKLSVLGSIIFMIALNPIMAQTPYMVKDITPGSGNSMNQSHNIVDMNGIAYFPASNSLGQELWRSDGTDAGTYLVKELVSGSGSGMSNGGEICKMGNLIFFGGGSSDVLYKSDGTNAGTVVVSSSPVAHTSPSNFTTVNSTLFFNANGGVGLELWKTDGVTASQVKDIRPGGLSSAGTDPMIDFNGTLYFYANDGTNGGELWKSDGTDAGTVMVKNIHPTGSSNPANFVIANNILFFTADNGTNGRELWKTDGTDAGTVMIKDIYANGSAASINYTITSSYTYRMVEMNGKIYFPAIGSATTGQELWTSDGTDVGTVMVKDIFSGTSDAQISNLESINGTLYFQAISGAATALEPWKSDGTAAGTVIVSDINSGSSSPLFFTGYNNEVYFFANKTGFGNELWKTDGTSAGTSMVMDIRSGSSSGIVQNPEGSRLMQSIGGKLFFVANDGTNGAELWAVNATVTATSISATHISFNAYPNPAADKITIESKLEEGTIQLINMQGIILQSMPLQNDATTLDVQNLAEGMYIIKISNAEKIACKTFIKK